MNDEAGPAVVSTGRLSKRSVQSIDTSERTIIHWNITRFRNLLVIESDAGRRTLLSKLLAEEQAKLMPFLPPDSVQSRP